MSQTWIGSVQPGGRWIGADEGLSAVAYTSNGTGGGDWGTSSSWSPVGVPGTNPGDTVSSILAGDTITVPITDVRTIGDGSASIVLNVATGGLLSIVGGTLTIRGWANFGDGYHADPPTIPTVVLLSLATSGSTPANLILDGNSGVAPKITFGQAAKLEVVGTSSHWCSIRTKNAIDDGGASAGDPGYFLGYGSTTNFHINSQYCVFRYLGGSSTSGMGFPNLGLSTAELVFDHCLFDHCGVTPSFNINDGGVDCSITDCYGTNCEDTTFPAQFATTGAFFAANVGSGSSVPLTSGTRLIQRFVTDETGFAWFGGQQDFTIDDCTFIGGIFGADDLPTWKALTNSFIRKYTAVENAFGGGMGVAADGSSAPCYYLIDNPTNDFVPVFVLGSHLDSTVAYSVFEYNGTRSDGVVFGPSEGGSTNHQLAFKFNIVPPNSAGDSIGVGAGGANLQYQLSPSLTTRLAACEITHNTFYGCADRGFANMSFTPPNDDGGAGLAGEINALKANLVYRVGAPATGGCLLYDLGGLGTGGATAAGRVVDECAASVCTNNAWCGLDVSPTGYWLPSTGTIKVTSATGCTDGTVYNAPMSGSTAPGANDVVLGDPTTHQITAADASDTTGPMFVDPSRNLVAFDAHMMGGMGSTSHALAALAAQFDSSNPDYVSGYTTTALVAWVQAGFRPQNPLLASATYGGDPETLDAAGNALGGTIGAMAYFNNGTTKPPSGSTLDPSHPLHAQLAATGSAVWDFLEGTGTTSADSSGNSDTLTLDTSGGAGVAWSTNGSGPIVTFTGASAVPLSLASALTLPDSASYTIAWRGLQTSSGNNGGVCGNNSGFTAVQMFGGTSLNVLAGSTYNFSGATSFTSNDDWMLSFDEPAGQLHLYQNGTEVSGSPIAKSSFAAFGVDRLGSGFSGNTNALIGSLEYVRVMAGYAGSSADAASFHSSAYGIYSTVAATGARQITGATDTIAITPGTVLNGAVSFAISMWVKVLPGFTAAVAASTDKFGTLVVQLDNGMSRNVLALIQAAPGSAFSLGNSTPVLWLQIWDGGSNTAQFQTSFDLIGSWEGDGNFHNIVIDSNGTSLLSGSVSHLYADGVALTRGVWNGSGYTSGQWQQTGAIQSLVSGLATSSQPICLGGNGGFFAAPVGLVFGDDSPAIWVNRSSPTADQVIMGTTGTHNDILNLASGYRAEVVQKARLVDALSITGANPELGYESVFSGAVTGTSVVSGPFLFPPYSVTAAFTYSGVAHSPGSLTLTLTSTSGSIPSGDTVFTLSPSLGSFSPSTITLTGPGVTHGSSTLTIPPSLTPPLSESCDITDSAGVVPQTVAYSVATPLVQVISGSVLPEGNVVAFFPTVISGGAKVSATAMDFTGCTLTKNPGPGQVVVPMDALIPAFTGDDRSPHSWTCVGPSRLPYPLVGSLPIVGFTVTSGGSGYGSPPSVAVDAPAGSGGITATGTANLTGDVASVTVTNGGSGYGSAPLVAFDLPGGGTTASATANLSGGVVTSITVTNSGSGYTGPPSITIDPPGSGVRATATANFTGSVTSISVNNPGSGYSSVPTVTIGSGSATAVAVVDPRRAITGTWHYTTTQSRVFFNFSTAGGGGGTISYTTGASDTSIYNFPGLTPGDTYGLYRPVHDTFNGNGRSVGTPTTHAQYHVTDGVTSANHAEDQTTVDAYTFDKDRLYYRWILIGQVTVAGTTLTVTLSNAAGAGTLYDNGLMLLNESPPVFQPTDVVVFHGTDSWLSTQSFGAVGPTTLTLTMETISSWFPFNSASSRDMTIGYNWPYLTLGGDQLQSVFANQTKKGSSWQGTSVSIDDRGQLTAVGSGTTALLSLQALSVDANHGNGSDFWGWPGNNGEFGTGAPCVNFTTAGNPTLNFDPGFAFTDPSGTNFGPGGIAAGPKLSPYTFSQVMGQDPFPVFCRGFQLTCHAVNPDDIINVAFVYDANTDPAWTQMSHPAMIDRLAGRFHGGYMRNVIISGIIGNPISEWGQLHNENDLTYASPSIRNVIRVTAIDPVTDSGEMTLADYCFGRSVERAVVRVTAAGHGLVTGNSAANTGGFMSIPSQTANDTNGSTVDLDPGSQLIVAVIDADNFLCHVYAHSETTNFNTLAAPMTIDPSSSFTMTYGGGMPPYSDLVTLCNEAGMNFLANLPAASSDSLANELGKCAAAKLASGLKMGVPHSNEVWNNGIELNVSLVMSGYNNWLYGTSGGTQGYLCNTSFEWHMLRTQHLGMQARAGFTGVPEVRFTGACTTSAAAIAHVSGSGLVTAIQVTNGGSGYTVPPTVSILGGYGSGATATATISGGSVTGISGTGGSGYTLTGRNPEDVFPIFEGSSVAGPLEGVIAASLRFGFDVDYYATSAYVDNVPIFGGYGGNINGLFDTLTQGDLVDVAAMHALQGDASFEFSGQITTMTNAGVTGAKNLVIYEGGWAEMCPFGSDFNEKLRRGQQMTSHPKMFRLTLALMQRYEHVYGITSFCDFTLNDMSGVPLAAQWNTFLSDIQLVGTGSLSENTNPDDLSKVLSQVGGAHRYYASTPSAPTVSLGQSFTVIAAASFIVDGSMYLAPNSVSFN